MDIHEKMKEFAKTLEYQGVVPESLKRICNNPCTYLIWQQLLTQVKPKQECQKIKRSNIIVRLQASDKTDLNKTLYPIKELDLWEKKCRLQQDLDEINEYIRDKENVACNFTNEHKIIAIKRNNIRDRIKENESKTFLLKKKSEAFQREIGEIEENLIFFRNLTPVESTEEEPDVGDRLRKCAEKIESSLLKDEIVAPTCTKHNLFLTPNKTMMCSIFTTSDCSVEDYSQYEEHKKEIKDVVKCLNDVEISRDIKEVLYNTDARNVFNAIASDVDTLKIKLLNVIKNTTVYETISKEADRVDSIMELQAKQIENELQSLKDLKEIRRLKMLLARKENDVQTLLKQPDVKFGDLSEIYELYILQRKEAGLTALCNCVERQLASGRFIQDVKKELRDVNANISKLQQKLVDDLRNVNQKFELYKKMYKTMLSYREETKILVRKLNQFTSDLSWTLPLTYNLHSKEIEIFKEFPLEYNRRMNTSDGIVYFRDVIQDLATNIEEISPEALRTLLRLIDCPYDAPETLFYNLWQKKLKLHAQKSLRRTIKTFNYKNYSLEELEKEESYIDYAIEKFTEIKNTSSVKCSTQDVSTMKQIVKLWLELPYADYVSSKRTYEGKNLGHYQNMYDNLYNLIQEKILLGKSQAESKMEKPREKVFFRKDSLPNVPKTIEKEKPRPRSRSVYTSKSHNSDGSGSNRELKQYDNIYPWISRAISKNLYVEEYNGHKLVRMLNPLGAENTLAGYIGYNNLELTDTKTVVEW
ncbi:hypothetical protein QE152_g919 [Popillia japonica]|uniref:Uncharacterized protein n=1 Tax=Popillia japonica TaxID=7064 RepID=A0AAW1N740_POPJA